jgi:ribosomal protein L11 methyltransferase
MDKYYYVEIALNQEFQQEIDDLAYKSCECQGVEDFSIDEPKVDAILGERSYSGGDIPVNVISEVEAVIEHESPLRKYFFPNLELSKSFVSKIKNQFEMEAKLLSADIQDWNQEWRKHYKEITVSPNLSIVPAWEKEENSVNDKTKIYIYPGMGFGTGEHETTFLCMQSFEELRAQLPKNLLCLDFGCGSGILGIAVNKIYNSPVDLYDIDPAALENCRQNISLNDLSESQFRFLLPKDRKLIDKKYDLVFANILQNILLEEQVYLSKCLKPGGKIILSGLLNGQEDEVISAYLSQNPKLSHLRTITKGDWVAVEMAMNK